MVHQNRAAKAHLARLQPLLYYFQMKMRKQMAQVNLEIVLFRHNRNGAVIVRFLVAALRIWMLENAVWAALERKKARA